MKILSYKALSVLVKFPLVNAHNRNEIVLSMLNRCLKTVLYVQPGGDHLANRSISFTNMCKYNYVMFIKNQGNSDSGYIRG